MSVILKSDSVHKSFKTGAESRKVLSDVSMEIQHGEFVSIMGPSGSGKSTLLFSLSGMETIDSGKVLYSGREISGLGESSLARFLRNEVGFIFQQPSLLKNLNILDNIILPSVKNSNLSRRQIRNQAQDLMEQVGIGDLHNRSVTEVSGGQLQRAGICRALMKNPKIIFGDEPTGALDSVSSREIMEILKRINRQGTSIVLVTHDVNVAVESDRVFFMKDGTLVESVNFHLEKRKSCAEKLSVLQEMIVSLYS